MRTPTRAPTPGPGAMADRGRPSGAAATRHDEEIAAEEREAARLLLRHSLITAAGPQAEGFRLVRRHAEHLRSLFSQHLGYRLTVESTFARLVKPGLGRNSGRRLVRSTGAAFTPRGYTYLTLALSVLVTSADQMLLSQLVAGIRTAAVDAGIELGEPDRQSERRTIAAALRQLVEWGVLSEVDGSVLAYVDDRENDALLWIDREIARAVIAGPIRASQTPSDLVARASDAGPGGPRHAVRRRLVENPVVHLDDLTPAERGWLRNQQRREQRIFADQFGLDMEIRAEGALLVDPAEAMSDVAFPGTGTVSQAALLVAARLVARLRPDDAGHPATGARLVIGVPVPDAVLDVVLMQVTEEYAGPCGWARRYVDEPAALRRDVCELLVAMGLFGEADVAPRGHRTDEPATETTDTETTDAETTGTETTGTETTSRETTGTGTGNDLDADADADFDPATDSEVDPAVDPPMDAGADANPARDEDGQPSGPFNARKVTDTTAARGAATSGYVLLAAAARYLPRPTAARAASTASAANARGTRAGRTAARRSRPAESDRLDPDRLDPDRLSPERSGSDRLSPDGSGSEHRGQGEETVIG
jgi:uncharacterized protein (TIGR02678 family)